MRSRKKSVSLNVLITSAGVATAINIFNSLKSNSDCPISKLIACSDDQSCAMTVLADQHYTAPKISEEGYIQFIKNICEIEKINIIFPVHSSELILFADFYNEFQKAGVEIVCPSQTNIQLLNDKTKFSEFCSELNINSVKTFLDEKEWIYPVYCKPCFGSSSSGHFLLAKEQDRVTKLKNVKLRDYVFQEFVDAPEATVDAYRCYNSDDVFALPRWRIRVQDGKATSTKSFANPELTEISQNILEKIDYRGPCNLQFFFKNDTWKIIEINPRFSAGGLPLAIRCGLNSPGFAVRELIYNQQIGNVDLEFGVTMHRFLTEVFV